MKPGHLSIPVKSQMQNNPKKTTYSTAQSAKRFIKQTVAFLCQTVLQRANGFDFEEQIGSQL